MPPYIERAKVGKTRARDPQPNSLLNKKRLSSCLDKWKSWEKQRSSAGLHSFIACQQQQPPPSATNYQSCHIQNVRISFLKQSKWGATCRESLHITCRSQLDGIKKTKVSSITWNAAITRVISLGWKSYHLRSPTAVKVWFNFRVVRT